MTNDNRKTQVLTAYDDGFIDLDEYECAVAFKQRIVELERDVDILILDLRQCWVDYSHSALYVDSAIEKIRRQLHGHGELVIRTNVDLGSRESMACLFFQGSIELGCTIGMPPLDIVSKVTETCISKGLTLSIEIFPFAQAKNIEQPKIRYSYVVQ
jgi:hypothetical protein